MKKKQGSSASALILVLLFVLIGAVVTIIIALDSMTTGGAPRAECAVPGQPGTYPLSPDQMGNAAVIVGVGMQQRVGDRAIEIALATAMQESSLRNLDYGDRDSLGLFQQRPSQGWGSPDEVQDPFYAASIFYDRLLRVPNWGDLPLTVAAQSVQISAFPDAYAKHEGLATGLRSALAGAEPAALDCVLSASSGLDLPRLTTELSAAHPEAGIAVLGTGATLSAGPDATAEQLWALAHWAVATADWTGAREVRAAGHIWTRDGQWRAEGAATPSDDEPVDGAAGNAQAPGPLHVSIR